MEGEEEDKSSRHFDTFTYPSPAALLSPQRSHNAHTTNSSRRANTEVHAPRPPAAATAADHRRLKTPVRCPTRRSGRGRGSLRNADSLVVRCGDQAARGTAGFSLLNFGFFPDLVGFVSVAMLGEWSRRTEICSTIKL
ncbi:hypothetical protein PVAP13_9NG476228 [Panicum virgatum]|uniref:Uncharacterized protein n=1 Tax=Panicum virgatum TaxID=38727 RepID=A0A8T0MWL6_PANVG|nr:hypothetical protein PVAP13_9NG476228 [Panicum virgatum]